MKGHRAMRTQLALFGTAALLFSSLQAFAVQADGFVTQVDSPTDFYVGSLHVMLNGKTRCETEDLHSDIQLKTKGFWRHRYFLLQNRPVPKGEATVPCNALSLRGGSRVQVAGDRGQQDGSLTAAQLIVYKVDIQRKFSTSWKFPEWAGGALLEEQPQVSRTGQGWAGTLWLDGYPMNIAPDTELLTAPDVKQMGIGSLFQWIEPQFKATILRSKAPAPVFSASLLEPNTWATYRGARRADGQILLDQIGLWPNRPYSFWEEYPTKFDPRKAAPTIQPPNYASHLPGSAVFSPFNNIPFDFSRRNRVLTILPDRNVQEYISQLAASLMPLYQKDMPETSPTKIHFCFYVVQSGGADFDDEVSNFDSLPPLVRPSWDDAVLALPNGMIFVPVSTLTGVESEAQLAAILSSAIASVLQEQGNVAWYESQHQGGGGSVASGMSYRAFWPGFILWRDEQAIRIGIRQMYLAGYDIREAPFAWALAEGKPAANPVTDASGSNAGVPWYTAYAFNYISQFYSNVDYNKLKRGKAEYAQFLAELRKADPEAFVQKK